MDELKCISSFHTLSFINFPPSVHNRKKAVCFVFHSPSFQFMFFQFTQSLLPSENPTPLFSGLLYHDASHWDTVEKTHPEGHSTLL